MESIEELKPEEKVEKAEGSAERNISHIATTCKFVPVNLGEGESILVLIPTEIVPGRMNKNRNFVDLDNQVYLPAYEAYSKHEQYGYILEMGLADALARRIGILSATVGEDEEVVLKLPDIYKSNTHEYGEMVNSSIWFYRLDDPAPVLSCLDDNWFFAEYGFRIDRKAQVITFEAPEEKHKVEKAKPVVSIAPTKLTRKGLIEETLKTVIAQDDAVKEIVSLLYKPLVLKSNELKSNILIYGPTGVGKSYMIKTIASQLGIPFYRTCISDLSSSGYEGRSVNNIYLGLLNAANGNIELLQKGAIVYLDEGDKLVIGDRGANVKGQVYNELLETLEPDGVVDIQVTPMKSIQYRKDNLIVIVGGSFAKMADQKRKPGFGSDIGLHERTYYTSADFKEFGMPEEFMGRLPIRIPLRTLNEDDMYRILTESAGSPYCRHKKVLESHGITLDIPESVLRLMVDKSFALKAGARSLEGIFNVSVMPEMDEIMDAIDAGDVKRKSFTINERDVINRLKQYNG